MNVRSKVIFGLFAFAVIGFGTFAVNSVYKTKLTADALPTSVAGPTEASADGLTIKIPKSVFAVGEKIEVTFVNGRSTSYNFSNGCKLRLRNAVTDEIPGNQTACTEALVEVTPGQFMTQSFESLPVGTYVVSADLPQSSSEPVISEAPTLTSITPASTTIGHMIKLIGTGFTDATTVLWDGHEAYKSQAAMRANSTELSVFVPDQVRQCDQPGDSCEAVSGGLTAGVHKVTVKTANGTSSAQTVTVGPKTASTSVTEVSGTDIQEFNKKPDASPSPMSPGQPSPDSKRLELRFTVVESLKKQPTVAPTLSSVSPTAAKIGDRITLTGTGLLGATVLWDELEGTPEVTTKEYPPRTLPHIMTETELTITVPIELMPCNWANTECKAPAQGLSSGVHKLTVKNSKGTSDALTFTVIPATSTTPTTTLGKPTLSSINPTSGKIGDTITLTGAGFSKDVKVLWDGKPGAGFGATAVKLTSESTITVIVPEKVAICGDASVGQVKCEAEPMFLGSGAHQLTVKTDAGTSSEQTFTVTATNLKPAPTPLPTTVPIAAPTLNSVAPASARIGDTITLIGTEFTDATTVLWDGHEAYQSLAADRKNSTTLLVAVPKMIRQCEDSVDAGAGIKVSCAAVAGGLTGGVHKVTVKTAAGTSNEQTFTVIGTPAPTLTSVTPVTAKPGATLTLTGTGFVGKDPYGRDPNDELVTGVSISRSGMIPIGLKISKKTATTLTATLPATTGPACPFYYKLSFGLMKCPDQRLPDGTYELIVSNYAGQSKPIALTVSSATTPTPVPERPSTGGGATPITSSAPSITVVTPATVQGGKTVTINGKGLTSTSKITLSLKGKVKSTLVPTMATKDGSKVTFLAPQVASTKCVFSTFGCWPKTKTPGLDAGTYEVKVTTGKLTSGAKTLTLQP